MFGTSYTDIKALTATQVRDLYEADRSKLMAVLQVCADAMYLVQNRRGPFHRDIEAERALSQLKAIGVEPNK